MLPTLFTVLAITAAVAVAGGPLEEQDGGGSCTTNYDCYYNGVCSAASHQCTCQSVWTGPNCNVLAQSGPTYQLWPNPNLPLPPNDRVTDSWGITVAQDPATQLFHAYICTACVFSGTTPQPFSMHSSGIIAATAPALEGPYTYAGEFEGVFSEGPHMTRAPDGSFVLITPSSNNSGSPVLCTGDYRPAPVGSSREVLPLSSTSLVNKSTMFHSLSPAGPWQVHNFSLNETFDLIYFSNPSLALDGATGEAHLAWRVNLQAPVGKGETLGYARASAWNASLYEAIAEPLQPGLVGYEDPFIWVHVEEGGKKILSILEHTQTSDIAAVGGLFVSDDMGKTWRKSPIPAYSTTVPKMTGPGWSGKDETFLRRERPELHFDPVTGVPTHLLSGVMRGGAGPDGKWQLSYSVATRLGK